MPQKEINFDKAETIPSSVMSNNERFQDTPQNYHKTLQKLQI